MTPSTTAPRDRIVQLPTGPVHLREDGPADGAPVLLLHGTPGSLHWYDALTESLCDTYRIIRVDLRGHGGTGGRDGLGHTDQTAMVTEVLAYLGLDRVAAAAAHSFGADIAVDLAAADRADRVVLIGQAPDYRHAAYPPGLGLLVAPALVSLAQRVAPAAVIRFANRVAFAPGFRMSDRPGLAGRVVDDFRALSPAVPRVALTTRRRELATDPLDARVARVATPVLVVHGRRDRLYPLADTVTRYAAAGARTAVVDGAGHSPHVERPAEVADLFRTFLTDGTLPTR